MYKLPCPILASINNTFHRIAYICIHDIYFSNVITSGITVRENFVLQTVVRNVIMFIMTHKQAVAFIIIPTGGPLVNTGPAKLMFNIYLSFRIISTSLLSANAKCIPSISNLPGGQMHRLHFLKK